MFTNSISSYRATLADYLDSVDDFQVPDFVDGDVIRFEPYYASDEGGVGIIKTITTCEFKNKNYDPQDETSPDYDEKLQRNHLFISLPCAIVVSALPTETWLDYVPLTHMEVITLDQFMQEYAHAFPEQDAIDLWSVRLQVARKLSQHRLGSWLSDSYVSTVPAHSTIVSLQANTGGAQ